MGLLFAVDGSGWLDSWSRRGVRCRRWINALFGAHTTCIHTSRDVARAGNSNKVHASAKMSAMSSLGDAREGSIVCEGCWCCWVG